jgi:uncharacterized protein YbaR (Trm112 family)
MAWTVARGPWFANRAPLACPPARGPLSVVRWPACPRTVGLPARAPLACPPAREPWPMVQGSKQPNLAPKTAENRQKSTNQAQRGGGAMASALFSKNNPVKKHIN